MERHKNQPFAFKVFLHNNSLHIYLGLVHSYWFRALIIHDKIIKSTNTLPNKSQEYETLRMITFIFENFGGIVKVIHLVVLIFFSILSNIAMHQ